MVKEPRPVVLTAASKDLTVDNRAVGEREPSSEGRSSVTLMEVLFLVLHSLRHFSCPRIVVVLLHLLHLE